MYLLCSMASSTPHRSINTQIMDNAEKKSISDDASCTHVLLQQQLLYKQNSA